MADKPDVSEPTIFGEGFGEPHSVRPVPAPGEVCPNGDMAVMPEFARNQDYIREIRTRGSRAKLAGRADIVSGKHHR